MQKPCRRQYTGDPSKVVDVIMDEVQQTDRIDEFVHKGIVTFIDLIEGANADLSRLNMIMK